MNNKYSSSSSSSSSNNDKIIVNIMKLMGIKILFINFVGNNMLKLKGLI